MVEIPVTKEFKKQYRKLPFSIKLKAEKRIALFKKDIFCSSLRTEKLNPKDRQVWSFRIDQQYRIIFRFTETNKALFLMVGHHNWIYRYKF